MRNPFRTWSAAALGTCLLAGCAGAPADEGDGTSAVAAFYPFAYVTERVAGDQAAVTNLTAPGAEPHDLELSPQQVAEVAEADMVVYEKGFQPAVDDAVRENAQGAVVEVTKVVPLETEGEAHEGETHEGETHEGEAHEGESQEGESQEGEAHDGHGHGDLAGDPHIWQDPTKLAAVAQQVARTLARVDRQHAAEYRRNARDLVADLRALDRQYQQGLAECERRTFVTSHAAFGHLAHRYDLRMVPISGLSPDEEPSPARLAELEQVVADSGVTTIFSETLASPALARTLAAEVGVRTDVLDPVEGLTEATADEDYFSLMRSNLAALRKANGCT